MRGSRACAVQRRHLSISYLKHGRSSRVEINSLGGGRTLCAERGQRPYSVRAGIFPPRVAPDPSEMDRVVAPCDRQMVRKRRHASCAPPAALALAASAFRITPDRARIPARLDRSNPKLARAPQKTPHGKDRATE